MTPQTCPHCHSKISNPETSFCPICGLFRFGGLRNPHSFPSQFPETNLAMNHYASLGTRFLARIIDYTILGILTCLIDWSSGGALIEGWIWFYNGISGIPQVFFAVCISMILFLGYFVVFQSFSGQTPGKWLCPNCSAQTRPADSWVFLKCFPRNRSLDHCVDRRLASVDSHIFFKKQGLP